MSKRVQINLSLPRSQLDALWAIACRMGLHKHHRAEMIRAAIGEYIARHGAVHKPLWMEPVCYKCELKGIAVKATHKASWHDDNGEPGVPMDLCEHCAEDMQHAILDKEKQAG